MARLTAQLAQVDTIDTKGSALFTIGSTILPITASLLTADQAVVTNSTSAKVALVLGALLYIALVVVFLLSYRLAKWDSRPELEQWKSAIEDRLEEEMKQWLGDACADAYLSNTPQLRRKAALVGAAL